MPGANCSVFGCSTSRKQKGIAIFQLPTVKNETTRRWRDALLNIITRDREQDESLKRQIMKNSLHICELHFTEDDMYHYSTRKELMESVLPTKNLPVKSIPRKETPPRSTSVIEKMDKLRAIELSVPMKEMYKDYIEFTTRISKLKLDSSWTISMHNDFTEISQHIKASKGSEFLLPYIQIFVNCDLSFIIRCFGWILPKNNEIFSIHSSFLKITLSNFLLMLRSYHLCSGVDLVESENAIHLRHHIIPKSFSYANFSSNSKDVYNDMLSQDEFIRSSDCFILIKNTIKKCSSCVKNEIKVRAESNFKKKKLVEPAKLNAPIKFTSPERIKVTLQSHRIENTALRQKIEDITREIKQNSVMIDESLKNDLVDIFKGIPSEKIPPFMKLFWEEQQKYLRESHSTQIRYHPAIVKFCLSIAAKSPAAYNQLRLNSKEGTGVLVLPSQRTLRDYRNYIRPRQGFNPEVISELAQKTKNFHSSERFVTILFDEMKVQEDLVWSKSTGELIGFVDLGDSDLNESTFKRVDKLATHVLVFLVKSVKNPLSYSFANFATDGIQSHQLYQIFWKAVSILELTCNLHVVATVSDGAAANRKFIKMNKMEDDKSDVVYRTKNRFAEEHRYIYFFSDGPHLIKTARNCLWKSGSKNASRYMWNNGMYILWEHISALYKEDLECGLKLLPKLTSDHIYLNSYSVMKVKLATQVLSSTVGNVLETFGVPEAKATADFCLKFDSFFDCFNVRNTHEHKIRRKPFLKPYAEKDDSRFEWLNSFIAYLEKWKNSISERTGNFSQTDRNNMFISHQTYEGLKISIHALQELVPFLLDNGLDYILSERFCQDDVENYFGRQRSIGRRKDNPNVRDTLYADNIIKTQYDVTPIGGNVQSTIDKEIDSVPLRKRKKSSN